MERDTKSTPLVTIAIPIYNAEKYLRYAIQSCINQTYQNWELLLMCDGSTDASDKIAEEFSHVDKRIKFIDDHANKGLPTRLNESIKMALGKYYARMDADDIMAVNRLDEEVKFLEFHPEVDVVGSSMMLIDGKNQIIGSSLSTNDSMFVHPSVMGKTSWFKSNPYDAKLFRSQDFDLWSRTKRFSVFANIEQPLLFYRTFGMPTTQKLLRSYKTMRYLHLNYKRYGRTCFWGYSNFILFGIKSFVLKFLSLINLQGFVIKARRYKQVAIEQQLLDADLAQSIKDCM